MFARNDDNKLTPYGNKGQKSCIVKTEMQLVVMHRRKGKRNMRQTRNRKVESDRCVRDELGASFRFNPIAQRDNDIVPSASKTIRK